MSDSVLELIQGIFNSLLFVISVMFSILLLGVVMQRSEAVEIVKDNRSVYEKADAYGDVYTIKGSSVIDTVCKLISAEDNMEVTVNGVLLSKAVLDGICFDEAAAIEGFYELICTDKDYAVYFRYGAIKSLEITEEDE